jgi:hypothetical protein
MDKCRETFEACCLVGDIDYPTNKAAWIGFRAAWQHQQAVIDELRGDTMARCRNMLSYYVITDLDELKIPYDTQKHLTLIYDELDKAIKAELAFLEHWDKMRRPKND